MKTLIFAALVMAGLGTSAYAQGTVAFENYTTATVKGQVYSNSVATQVFGAVNLELFWGPLGDTAAQLLALNSGLVFSTVIIRPASGHFSDNTVAETSGPLGGGDADVNSVELLITGWVGTAEDYIDALINPTTTLIGQTQPFANPTGGGGNPAANAATMVNWTSANSLILEAPEPGTIALGGLSAAALLLFRRRRLARIRRSSANPAAFAAQRATRLITFVPAQILPRPAVLRYDESWDAPLDGV